jgi:hypothetical protein
MICKRTGVDKTPKSSAARSGVSEEISGNPAPLID